MRKGTFSVQKANPNSSKHNSRELAPKYLIDSSQKNYYELITPDDDFKKIAQQIYKQKVKQTMQKKQLDNLIQETVLTLKPNQDENDVKNLFKKLNKKFGGHELLEVAIHRDEGYFLNHDIAYYPTKNILKKDDDWYICSNTSIKKPKVTDFDKKVNIDEFEKVYNIHAHAKFSMFDRELGKSARMQKKDMSSRIKFVSDFLGLKFAPDKATRRIKKSVNLVKDEHLARARAMEQELARTKDLQEINKQLREELKQAGAVRKDYAQLEALNKELKEKIKEKDLTIDELNLIIDEYKQNKAPKTNENILNDKSIELKEKEVLEQIQELKKDVFHPKFTIDKKPAKYKEVANYYIKENKSLQEQNKVLESKVITLEEKIVSSATIIATLEQKLKNIINFANEKIKSLLQFKILNNYNLKKSRNWQTYIDTTREDYWEELVYYNTKELDTLYKESLDVELIELEDIDLDLKEELEDKKNIEDKEIKEIELKEIKEEVKEDYYQILNR